MTDQPDTLGGRLEAFQKSRGLDDAGLAAYLGCTAGDLEYLRILWWGAPAAEGLQALSWEGSLALDTERLAEALGLTGGGPTPP